MKDRFRMEIKSLSDAGTFTGRLSVYNLIDAGNDVVEQGAFSKTIAEHGGEVPMLWQHKSDMPIGKLKLRDTEQALEVDGQLLMELPEAQKAYLLMKAGIVRGLSIGYEVIKKATDGSVRKLKELKLYEGSVVTFPMNEMALITSIKGRRLTKDDFTTELAEAQLMDAPNDYRCALACSLSSIVWDLDMSRDEKISASETSIQQFSDAYMAMLPSYLDALQMNGDDGMEMMSRKEGRRLSGVSRQAIQDCIDQLTALLAEEAGGDSTSNAEAASKPEPDNHSALSSLLRKAKESLEWTYNSNLRN